MQRKDQDAILKQMVHYAKSQNYSNEIIKLLDDGSCFGFSLIRASMRKTGYLKWWKGALDRCLSWDRTIDSLHNAFMLPQAKKIITYKQLFEKLAQYFLYNQQCIIHDPEIIYRQDHFLLPDNHFYLLGSKNEILTIKENYRISGYFSVDDFIKIFSENETIQAITNNICLIQNHEHCCELTYEKGRWDLYNPNYNDGDAISFTHVKELAGEVFNILSNSIRIEIACFTYAYAKPFSHYHNVMLNENPEQLVQENGLSAIFCFNIEIVPTLLRNIISRKNIHLLNLNETFPNQSTPLICAILFSNIETVKMLCLQGAKLNQADKNGMTPLLHIMHHRFFDAIQPLCLAGFNLNQPDEDNITPLMYAIDADLFDAIQPLCLAGANPNQVDENGIPLLIYAVSTEAFDAVKPLCLAGAYPNLSDSDGSTPLMHAIKSRNVSVVNTILNFQPNINQVNNAGCTALIFSVIYRNKEVFDTLLSCDADVNITLLADVSILLEIAAQYNRSAEVRHFIKNDDEYIPGFTAIHFAVISNQIEMVKQLINKIQKMPVDTYDNLRNMAYAFDHQDIVNLLQTSFEICVKDDEIFAISIIENRKRKAEIDVNLKPTKKIKIEYNSSENTFQLFPRVTQKNKTNSSNDAKNAAPLIF